MWGRLLVGIAMTTFLRWLVTFFFRFRAFNEDVLTTPGPVLLVPTSLMAGRQESGFVCPRDKPLPVRIDSRL